MAGSVRYAGEVFQGYNKPKRTPGEDKKFAVLVKDDDGDDKIVRFGDPSMQNYRNGPDDRGGMATKSAGKTSREGTTAPRKMTRQRRVGGLAIGRGCI